MENIIKVDLNACNETLDADVLLMKDEDMNNIDMSSRDEVANLYLSKIFDTNYYFDINYGFDVEKYKNLLNEFNFANDESMEHAIHGYLKDDSDSFQIPEENVLKLDSYADLEKYDLLKLYETENGEGKPFFYARICFECLGYSDTPTYDIELNTYGDTYTVYETFKFEKQEDVCKFLRGLTECICSIDNEYVKRLLKIENKELENHMRINSTLINLLK